MNIRKLALFAVLALASAAVAHAQLVLNFSTVSNITNSSEATGSAVSGTLNFDPATGSYTLTIQNDSSGVIVNIGANIEGLELPEQSTNDADGINFSYGSIETNGATMDGSKGFGNYTSEIDADAPEPVNGLGAGAEAVFTGQLSGYTAGDINTVADLLAYINGQRGTDEHFDLFFRIKSIEDSEAGSDKIGVTLVAVPEVEAYALFGLGFLGFLAVRRRLKARSA